MNEVEQYFGYAGNILTVDLGSGASSTEPLDMDAAGKYIGGFGLSNYLGYENIPAGVDALSADNLVIVGAGALCGTAAPGASKTMATTKLVTGTVGTCFGGGGFGPVLKWAGYDHVIIRGGSDAPVYVLIEDDSVRLCDASDLWGLDIYETTDALHKRHGASANVIAIGKAGENKVAVAFTLVNKYGTLGRGGLGAVLGAKNCKAIVARGSKGIRVADAREFMRVANEIHKKIMSISFREDWVKQGLYLGWPMWCKQIKARRDNPSFDEDKATELFGSAVYERMFERAVSCPSACPLADKAVVRLLSGERKGERLPVSYGLGATMTWAALFDIDDISQSVQCYDVCNRYGLDGMATVHLVDFAITLYENEVISRDDADGMELRRDYDTVMKMIEKIAHREGIGDVLARGMVPAAEEFGERSLPFAAHIKGLNPMGDPRPHLEGMMGISQFVSPGRCYATQGNTPAFLPGRPPAKFRRYAEKIGTDANALGRIFVGDGFSLPRLVAHAENWYALCSSLGVCSRQPVIQSYELDTAASLYNAATGAGLTPEDAIKAAERGWTILKMANVREGFDRKDDKYPREFFKPLQTVSGEMRLSDYNHERYLTPEDVEKMFDEYYDERGWTLKSGVPARGKLAELGLERVADELSDRLA